MERIPIHRGKLLSLIACAFLVNTMNVSSSHAQGPPKPDTVKAPASVFCAYKRPVTIWVPPYAVAKSKAQITASFDGIGMKDAITHLALQFWIPTPQGGIEQVKMDEVNDRAIIELRDWGRVNGIRVLLCVYNHNGAKGWDWELAKAAFADHPETFVKSLVAEVERLGLDGVDMDLEGNGSLDTDKAAFLSFMTILSKELRARGKHLTVDSFSYIWNAPNQNWWPELFPLVDALTTMGYDEIGSTAPEWRGFEAQKKAAGAHAAKLQIGMPSGREQWRGNTNLEQLQWVQKDASMGIAIWDAQLRSVAWKTSAVWQAIQGIRGTP